MNQRIIISNLIWRFLERSGAQVVTFAITIILARMLDPSVYGTIALITVIISILQVFVDGGMGNALIQKKNADDLDFSSVFFFNLFMCLLLYVLIFIAAPSIACFYDIPELTNITRVLGLVVVVSGVKSIQQSYVSRNFLFKKFFYSTLGGTIGAAIAGIWMAYRGHGIWALVVQYLLNNIIDTIVLWNVVKWRPKKIFSFSRLKALFQYGWKLLASTLMDTVYENLRQLVIGKVYSSGDLAFFNKGRSFPEIIVANINTSINSVLFSSLSNIQDDRKQIKSSVRRAMKTSIYFIAPLMVGLAICAKSIVKLILTEKWIGCVFYLRVFCFVFAFYPIHILNLNAIKAMGRSDIFLKLEIIKKIIDFIVLIFTVRRGVKAIAFGMIFTSILSQIINSWPNRKLFGYSYWEQIKDILPSLILASAMGGIVYLFTLLELSDIGVLLLQIILGILIYWLGSIIFRLEPYQYAMDMVKSSLSVWKL
ncbi:MAG: lipopolysaccharide biosynthesis protein [Lachnospiraceae bacterium]|nr:lipopolysaccharide biosynthesis protein [Lachnospiraceae bacterium]